jgi:RNA polymerase sigma factor (sigma-70 family)
LNNTYRKELGEKELITKAEFDELFRKFKYENDTKAFNKIIEANLRLVVYFANQYENITDGIITIDDLINEGNVGLIQALNNYDETKNIKFSYYASFWIKKMIIDVIKKNQIPDVYASDCIEIEDEIENTDNEDEMKMKLKVGLKHLNTKQRTAIKLYYGLDGEPLNQEEIGEVLGVTKQRVSQIIDKALKKLKELLNEN